MNIRKLNWPIWAGFLLSLFAFLSYFFIFIWFTVTRDFPWANLLLFGIAAALCWLEFGVPLRQTGAGCRRSPAQS